jgi:type IV secretory pathway VirB2 component (pilin)
MKYERRNSMKKYSKVITVIMVVLLLVSVAMPVLANSTIGGIDVSPSANPAGKDDISRIGRDIIAIVRIVGIILSVIILSILGIKYMMGSAAEKAEYKKTLIPYVVGAALIFAASFFATTVFNWASGLGG